MYNYLVHILWFHFTNKRKNFVHYFNYIHELKSDRIEMSLLHIAHRIMHELNRTTKD